MKKKIKRQIVFRPGLIKAMMEKGKIFIEKIRDKLDELNFWPVPDKDTGKNAYLIFKGIVDAISERDYATLEELTEDLLEHAQDSARGNIGAAIANGFIGFFSVLNEEGIRAEELAPEIWQWVEEISLHEAKKEKIKVMDGNVLARALSAGFEKAYQGFNPPEKKTVLDVMKAASKEALARVKAGEEDTPIILEKAIAKAKDALAKTKGKIYKGEIISTEDAGAATFIPILEAFLEVFIEEGIYKDKKAKSNSIINSI